MSAEEGGRDQRGRATGNRPERSRAQITEFKSAVPVPFDSANKKLPAANRRERRTEPHRRPALRKE